MRIAILGSGAAGSVFASYLKMGGADDITLVDLYKAHMDTIAERGLTMRYPQGEITQTGFKTAYSAENIGVMDIVIVMVKCTQTVTVLEASKNCIGPETVIVSLQNGLGNEDECMKFAPAERVMFGCGNMGTELPEPGVCVAKPHPGTNMFIGPAVKSELNDRAGKYLEACFAKGGLEPKYFDDVRPNIWKKVTSNAANNTVCAVLGLKIREVDADPDGRELVFGVYREASAVAEAMGIPGLWEFIQEDHKHLLVGLGDYYPSMAQDMLIHQRQTEVDFMTGAIARYGKRVGVPTPTCDVLTKVVRCKQANYALLYKKA